MKTSLIPVAVLAAALAACGGGGGDSGSSPTAVSAAPAPAAATNTALSNTAAQGAGSSGTASNTPAAAPAPAPTAAPAPTSVAAPAPAPVAAPSPASSGNSSSNSSSGSGSASGSGMAQATTWPISQILAKGLSHPFATGSGSSARNFAVNLTSAGGRTTDAQGSYSQTWEWSVMNGQWRLQQWSDFNSSVQRNCASMVSSAIPATAKAGESGMVLGCHMTNYYPSAPTFAPTTSAARVNWQVRSSTKAGHVLVCLNDALCFRGDQAGNLDTSKLPWINENGMLAGFATPIATDASQVPWTAQAALLNMYNNMQNGRTHVLRTNWVLDPGIAEPRYTASIAYVTEEISGSSNTRSLRFRAGNNVGAYIWSANLLIEGWDLPFFSSVKDEPEVGRNFTTFLGSRSGTIRTLGKVGPGMTLSQAELDLALLLGSVTYQPNADSSYAEFRWHDDRMCILVTYRMAIASGTIGEYCWSPDLKYRGWVQYASRLGSSTFSTDPAFMAP